MVTIYGEEITSAFTGGESVEAIYANGVKVWPSDPSGVYYVKWWPKSASGSFIMGGEARWLEDYNGYYSGPFLSMSWTGHPSKSYVMDAYAFRSTTGVQVIETNLVGISFGAFIDCTALVVSASQCEATIWGNYGITDTFVGCDIRRVYLPVCSFIGGNQFSGCHSLSYVYAPQALTVGDFGFVGCHNLVDVELTNCGTLQDNAFQACYLLSDLYLPRCSAMGESVFLSCSNFSTLTLGYSGVCSGLAGALADSPLYFGHGSIYVPLEWLSEYKSTYRGLSGVFYPIPHN